MLWKIWCFALQSMGHTNHKFPVYATGAIRIYTMEDKSPFMNTTLRSLFHAQNIIADKITFSMVDNTIVRRVSSRIIFSWRERGGWGS